MWQTTEATSFMGSNQQIEYADTNIEQDTGSNPSPT